MKGTGGEGGERTLDTVYLGVTDDSCSSCSRSCCVRPQQTEQARKGGAQLGSRAQFTRPTVL